MVIFHSLVSVYQWVTVAFPEFFGTSGPGGLGCHEDSKPRARQASQARARRGRREVLDGKESHRGLTNPGGLASQGFSMCNPL